LQELMDRALKERIIGAIVLVVFAVLVVPVFLDGPSKQGSDVSEAITLPGQNGTANKTQTIVLDRDRTEPVPAGNPEPDKAAAAEEETVTEDSPPPAPAELVAKVQPEQPATAPPDENSVAKEQAPATTESGPQSTTGMWAVQLGSFSSKQNAERLAADLRDNGYAAFLSQLNKGDTPLHRVRVGPQKDRQDAEAVAGKLAAQGHKGQVVPHP
jgi:DedD protein